MKEFDELKQLEQKIAEKIEEIKSAIEKTIEDNPLEGVTSISKHPRACIVSLSTAKKHKDTLAAEYYIPASQANLVARKLTNAKTATAFTEAIEEMVKTGIVKIGQNSHRLNDKTIEILQGYI